MDLPFSYDKIASGKNLLCRDKEIDAIVSSLLKQRSVAVCGAPKTGKESVVRAALDKLTSKRLNYILCEIDLCSIRSYGDLIETIKDSIVNVFKEINRFAILPFEIETSGLSDKKILDLPEIISMETSRPMIVYFKNFQNILAIEDSSFDIGEIEKIWSRHKSARYIFTGAFINMMKYIFLEKKYFYFMTDTVTLPPVEAKYLIDYIVSAFLNTGRVIEQEQAAQIASFTGCNPWLAKRLCSICMSFPIGYVNRNIVEQAEGILLSINTPRYMQTMLDLTQNQINFLRAVLDKVQRFSSADILEKYRLNSSANVFRLKDALKKKEIVTFDQNDVAHIIDPLFEYWLKNNYFKKQQ